MGRARLTPSASTVDTFVSGRGAPGLSQLAEGLKQIAPELGRFSDIQAKRQSEAEKARGEQTAREYAESGKSFNEAIKSGIISKSESPWFQLGAKEQFGRVSAGRYNDDLTRALQEDPIMSSTTDARAFDVFEQKFRADWMGANASERDLHFEQGFGSLTDALTNDARRAFTAQAGNRLEKFAENNQYEELFRHFDTEIQAGTTHDAIAEGVNILTARAVASGQDPRVVNAATIKSLSDIVRRTGDTSLFDMLKSVRTSKGNTLYGTAQAQEAIRESEDYVAVETQRKNQAAESKTRAERDEQATAIYGGVVDRLMSAANPSAVDISGEVKAMAKINPALANDLIAFKRTATGEAFESNQEVVNSTLGDIFMHGPKSAGYVNVRKLVKLMADGSINQQDFNTLKGHLDKRENDIQEGIDRANRNGADSDGPYKDTIFRDALTGLRSLFVGENEDFDAGKSERAQQAQSQFIARWLQWSRENPNAGMQAKNDFLALERDRTAKDFRLEADQESAEKMKPAQTGRRWQTLPMLSLRDLNMLELEFKNGKPMHRETIAYFKRHGILPNEMGAFFRAQRSLQNGQ